MIGTLRTVPFPQRVRCDTVDLVVVKNKGGIFALSPGQGFSSTIPSIWIEFLSFCGVCATGASVMRLGGDKTAFLFNFPLVCCVD